MVFQKSFSVATSGRGTTDVTAMVQEIVHESGSQKGLAHVFIHHTSASLMLCENADPQVRYDLETFMSRLAPDGDQDFRHVSEGPDDMPAHVRSVLTQTGLSIPVKGGKADLGTWQGVYLWEHRQLAHDRTVTVSIVS